MSYRMTLDAIQAAANHNPGRLGEDLAAFDQDLESGDLDLLDSLDDGDLANWGPLGIFIGNAAQYTHPNAEGWRGLSYSTMGAQYAAIRFAAEVEDQLLDLHTQEQA